MLAEKSPRNLDDDERAAFRAAGFLSVRDFAAPGDVARLRELVAATFASSAGIAAGDRGDIIGDRDRDGTVPQLVHIGLYEPRVLDSPVRERAFTLAFDLLGPDAALLCETGILKKAGSPDPTPWHQDEAFWAPDLAQDGISIWIALQDVDVDGGCMEFVPGSHREDVRAHRPVAGVEAANGYELTEIDHRFRTVCPLPAGGATVHHSRTAHATGSNRSGVDRYAYVMVFAGNRRTLETPRDFHWQGARDRDHRTKSFESGLDGLVNRLLRRLAFIVCGLNASNDRRRYRKSSSR